MLERHSDAGASLARCTAANRVHHHHDGAVAGGKDTVYFFGGAGLLDTKAREVLPHGDEKTFWISHALNVADCLVALAKPVVESRESSGDLRAGGGRTRTRIKSKSTPT